MEERIFLEEHRGEFSNNVENAINVALSTKTRLVPNEDMISDFSLFKQYNRERDECGNYRLILTINPICSNILFNAKTEVVINEGSSACTTIRDNVYTVNKKQYAPKALNKTNPIDYKQVIRDTEYSHQDNGGFVYHCGFDIFNNHLLRKKEFIHVNKYNETHNESTKLSEPVYNTILDYNRDGRGFIVEEEISIPTKKKGEKTKTHLYQYDTIMPLQVAFADNCIEKNGWWGFTNPGTIEIENNDENISINRLMANNKPCEFIDLYPDRSLYSFIPKYNKYRKRIEKNWEYCITYPFAKEWEKIDEICGGKNQAIRANMKFTYNSSSIPIIVCSSYFKHNFKAGDIVTFYYYYPHYEVRKRETNVDLTPVLSSDGKTYNFYLTTEVDDLGNPKEGVEIYRTANKASMEFVKYTIKVKVLSVGDLNGNNKDRIFTVKYSDIESIYDYMKYFGCFYKKNSGNSECSYYFRKFKKLKTINGDNIKSDINKVGFGKNIYGDDIAQLIFTDDINIKGLLDHNERPLSEIYLTIVKTNKGHEKWYSNIDGVGDADVEYSHCFGKITSGIDFCGIEEEPFDYNIHYLHNISKPNVVTRQISNTISAWGDTILMGVPKVLEDDITMDNFDEFYGDIVEYDTYKAEETVIGNVYHRFNTAQREIWSNEYRDLYNDTIVADDYDVVANSNDYKEFTVKTYYLNDTQTPTREVKPNAIIGNLVYGNIFPEGYFYNPHIKLNVRENNDVENTSPAKEINYKYFDFEKKSTFLLIKSNGEILIYDKEINAEMNAENGDVIVNQGCKYEIKLTPPINYGFYKGDYVAFYNKNTHETNWGEIVSVSGTEITLRFDEDAFSSIGLVKKEHFAPYSAERCFYAYWSPNNVPTYAKLCEGVKKFTWKTIIPPSEMMRDRELYEIPFTNGRFYLEKNINFYLKRQDPHGNYGLSFPVFKRYTQAISNPMVKFSVNRTTPIDFTRIMYTVNNLTNTCY